MTNDIEQFDKPSERQKQEYSPPKLTDYGSVAKLTLAQKGFIGNDGNSKCTGQGSDVECVPS